MKRMACVLTALLMVFMLPARLPAAASARAEGEYTLPREEGTRQVVFYWYGDGVDYEKCDMSIPVNTE